MKTPLIILLAAVAGLTACHRRAAAPAPLIRPVLSIVVAPEAVGGAAFAGTVDARYESILGFRVLGRMIARDVSVGDYVKQGARLATLDPTPFQLELRDTEADLARADAHLQEAKSNAARQRQLFSKGVSAKADFEAAQHEEESAEASTEAAQANVRVAQEKLSYTELHAEFDGVIAATKAEVGQVVQPGQEVVHVIRPEEREAVVDVPDNIAVNLRPGTSFVVTSEAEPATRVKGQVREIAPQADLATRTRRVRITLIDPPPNFRLGTIVNAVAAMNAGAEIDLPSSALLERDGKTFVWVVDPATSKASTREVKLGARDADSFRVVEGLAAGTRVVTAGVHSLLPDQVVKIQDTQL
jgi:RND family efflux transporter MFP subunit